MLSRIATLCLVCLVQIAPVASAENFSINFDGGPLIDLMQEITKQNDGFVPNVLLADEARTVKIPPLHLAEVNLNELMGALVYMNLPLRIKMTSNEVWSASGYSPVGEVQINSIHGLLDPNKPVHFKVDDIATAIRTAWDMVPSLIEPTMKVHLETGLLIVQGDERSQNIASGIIDQLSGQQASSENDQANQRTEAELRSLRQRCEGLKAMVDRLKMENDFLKQKLGIGSGDPQKAD